MRTGAVEEFRPARTNYGGIFGRITRMESMNRIYQGRVTKVEMPNPKAGRREPDEEPWIAFHPDPARAHFITRRIAELREQAELQRAERCKQPSVKSAKTGALKEYDDLRSEWHREGRLVLWKHHRRFQDTVNYYLAVFAALIPSECDREDWKEFRNALICGWEGFTGRQGSWRRPFAIPCKLVGCSPKASFYEFRTRLLSLTGSKATDAERFAALEQIFRPVRSLVGQIHDSEQAVDASLKGKAKDQANKLSVLASRISGDTPDNIKGGQQWRAHAAAKKVESGGILQWGDVFAFKTTDSSVDWPIADARVEIPQVLTEVIHAVCKKARAAKKKEVRARIVKLAWQLRSHREALATWCNDPATELPKKKPTRKGSGGDDLRTAMIFVFRPDFAGFRDAFLLFNQKYLKVPALVTSDAAWAARMAGGVEHRVFPLFCDLLTNRLNDETLDKGVWWDFERQAFFEVFTKIGQFVVTERKFAIRLKKAEERIAEINLRKKTDPRLQAIELLAQEMAGGALDEQGNPRLYSIRVRTLKAWRKVCKSWLELLEANPDATSEMLVYKKSELQKKYRERFGSPALFERLAQTRFHEIWRHNEADDRLQIWAKYVEACEEKEHLEAERTFAPAHAQYSPRFFRWSESSNKKHLPLRTTGDDFVVDVDALDFTTREKSKLRIHFRAPRLIRDGLRGPGEKLDERDQTWMPPALRALVNERGWRCDKQTFTGTSVRLSPTSINDIQLIFEPTLHVEALPAKWNQEFPFEARREKQKSADKWTPAGLAWPKDGNRPVWVDSGKVNCLSVDLGLTNSAAWHVLSATVGENAGVAGQLVHRLNADDDSPAWFVRSVANGIVRVSGEDRLVFRKINDRDRCSRSQKISRALKEAGPTATHAFLPELSGSRGRKAEPEELSIAERLFTKLKGCGFDIDQQIPDWKKRLSFPEQNDELIWGLKRLRSQLFRLHRWAEQLNGDSACKPCQAAMENIANLKSDDPLVDLKGLTDTLRNRIAELAVDYLRSFKELLPDVADRILPSRRGRYVWKPLPDGWHEMTLDELQPRKDALLAGQRGISVARLNQLRDLRELAQSLNHRCRHKIEKRYEIRRGDFVPEPFEGCRRAIEDAREDRAKQIAHQIFTAALGVEIAPPPPDKKKRKQTESLHGVYRCLQRGPVNFIALENLTDYRMSSQQGRRENRQLATWAHRRIHKILEELCQLVGLPIVLVQPDLTSHFSAKDHGAGFRAEEVRKSDSRSFLWRKRAENEDGDEWKDFIQLFNQLPADGSLLLPKRGGEVFVPLACSGNSMAERFYNADLNAAYRIGMRALAHPDRAELMLIAWLPRKTGALNSEKTGQKRNVPYLVDVAGVLGGEREEGCGFPVVPRSEEIWERVYGSQAWLRCMEINQARLKEYQRRVDQDDHIPN